MSRHRSYGKSVKGETKRNVLKRFERIEVLRKLGRWDDATAKKVTGLLKTPVLYFFCLFWIHLLLKFLFLTSNKTLI